MTDRPGENLGAQRTVADSDLPPTISDTTLQGLRAATTILENIRIIGHSVRGIYMIDDLQDEGLLGPDEDFDEARLRALQAVSQMASFEEGVIARGDPTPEDMEFLPTR